MVSSFPMTILEPTWITAAEPLMMNWRKNFLEHAGKVLAEIWSNLVVDKFPCVAEYVDPSNSEILLSNIVNQDQNWFDVQVRTSQYFTQIVKCQDESCFSKPKSSYFSIVPGRFLPPPLSISQTSEGLKIKNRILFFSIVICLTESQIGRSYSPFGKGS